MINRSFQHIKRDWIPHKYGLTKDEWLKASMEEGKQRIVKGETRLEDHYLKVIRKLGLFKIELTLYGAPGNFFDCTVKLPVQHRFCPVKT